MRLLARRSIARGAGLGWGEPQPPPRVRQPTSEQGRQHFLSFLPLPQGHGSFGPTFPCGSAAVAPLIELMRREGAWEWKGKPDAWVQAPLHAFHLLGLIGDAAATPALIDVIVEQDSGDLVPETAAGVLAPLGPVAIPALTAALVERDAKDPYARSALANGLIEIATLHAIDRPLTSTEMGELRQLTSRAEISSTRLSNVYHYGSLQGDPIALMHRYFDAMVSLNSWGTRRVMFRLPRPPALPSDFDAYLRAGTIKVDDTHDHILLILERREEDESGWIEDSWAQSLMPAIAPLRAELLRGDLGAAYVAWLSCAVSEAMGVPRRDRSSSSRPAQNASTMPGSERSWRLMREPGKPQDRPKKPLGRSESPPSSATLKRPGARSKQGSSRGRRRATISPSRCCSICARLQRSKAQRTHLSCVLSSWPSATLARQRSFVAFASTGWWGDADLKNIIRDRQARTGESYSAARLHVLRARDQRLGLHVAAPEAPPAVAAPEASGTVEAAVIKVNLQSIRVHILGETDQVTLRSSALRRSIPGHLTTRARGSASATCSSSEPGSRCPTTIALRTRCIEASRRHQPSLLPPGPS
jgi:hypothetical protein